MLTFSTSDPAALAAYHAAIEAQRDFLERVFDRDRGGVDGAMYGLKLEHSGRLYGGSSKLVGLATRGGTRPGWKWSGTGRNRYLVPRAGVEGAAARRWLEEHQPPAATNEYHALEAHGMPRNDLVGGGYRQPELFEHDGVLWVGYQGEPGHVEYLTLTPERRECTWTPRTTAEFLAAKYTRQAAEEAGQAAQAGVR